MKKNKFNSDKALRKAKIDSLIEKGRKIINTKEELLSCPLGSIVSFITTDDMYYQDGYLVRIGEKTFSLILDLTDDAEIVKIKFKNINTMYVGFVYETKNDTVSIHKSDNKRTNFPVKINNTVIYYAKDKFDMMRFTNTDKYKRIIKWLSIFGNNITTKN